MVDSVVRNLTLVETSENYLLHWDLKAQLIFQSYYEYPVLLKLGVFPLLYAMCPALVAVAGRPQ